MYLFEYFEKEEKPKVSIDAIKFLSNQLEEFLNIYEKEVYIENEKDKETVRRLREISTLLKNERYEQLIVDPMAVIDFNTVTDEYLPDYFPI